MKYDFTAIEQKWQKRWKEANAFHAVTGDTTRKKWYGLVEFPYPSGQGLHVGHARPYTAMDVIARKKRMDGYNVLFPIGYDAFGLPTENYAIKNHIHPAKVTHDNIHNFRKQLEMLGYSFDWDREINTTDPGYYKWTQWIFLQLFKKGLAYKTSMPVNWCTSCKCVLANEEVVNGVCERCGSARYPQGEEPVDAEDHRLRPEADRRSGRPWTSCDAWSRLSRRTGSAVPPVRRSTSSTTEGDMLTVYTTRADTLFGATYMVIAPEHACVNKWADKLTNLDEVQAYVAALPPPSPTLSVPSWPRKRPASSWRASGPSTPSTARRSPSLSPTMFWQLMAPAPLWPFQPMTTRDWDFAKTV